MRARLSALLLSSSVALAAASLGACTAQRQPPVLHPQVQPGPAANAMPSRVLVLPAACGSVEAPCPQSYLSAVDAIVRGGLEFVGHNVVESEALLNETRQRHEERDTKTTDSVSESQTETNRALGFDETVTSRSSGTQVETNRRVVLDGPTFEDLSVTERHEVLTKVGADAVVSTRIIVGGQIGVWTPNQNVEVMVKLGVQQGDAMAWASRCLASSNDFSSVDAALEAAARCAIYGATGRQEQR